MIAGRGGMFWWVGLTLGVWGILFFWIWYCTISLRGWNICLGRFESVWKYPTVISESSCTACSTEFQSVCWCPVFQRHITLWGQQSIERQKPWCLGDTIWLHLTPRTLLLPKALKVSIRCACLDSEYSSSRIKSNSLGVASMSKGLSLSDTRTWVELGQFRDSGILCKGVLVDEDQEVGWRARNLWGFELACETCSLD